MNAATVLTVYQEGNIIIELCVCIFLYTFSGRFSWFSLARQLTFLIKWVRWIKLIVFVQQQWFPSLTSDSSALRCGALEDVVGGGCESTRCQDLIIAHIFGALLALQAEALLSL